MAVQSSKGDVDVRKIRLPKTNLEEEENAQSKERGHQEYPRCLYKAGGKTLEVTDEPTCKAAEAAGWVKHPSEVPHEKKSDETPGDAPTAAKGKKK